MRVDVVTFGCRLNTYKSEVIRRQARAADLPNHRLQHLRGDRRGGAAGRQAIRRPSANGRRRASCHGLRGADRPGGFADMPEVDLVLGNGEKISAQAWPRRVVLCARRSASPPTCSRVNDIMTVRETAGHLIDGFEGRARAYVQVQNGCDHRCTFCIIPYGRGNSRSVPVGEVVAQVRRCARPAIAKSC